MSELINSPRSIDTYSLIDRATDVKRTRYSGPEKDHFFKVRMLGVRDSRNVLLNVPAIRSYLSEVAPVPFHPEFPYGEEIDAALTKHVPSYKTYNMVLNKEHIFKPYQRTVGLCRDSVDEIKGVQILELHDDTKVLAFGWFGKLNLLGAVNPTSGVDGIRLRCRNILLGNKDTLSSLFKETRFNHYLVGEVHTVDNSLIPNSRRDDFEDSDTKGKLFNEFLKEIGIPFSKKIRDLSKERGKTKNSDSVRALFEQAVAVKKYGYLSSYQRDRIVAHLDNVNGSHSPEEVQLAKRLSQELQAAQHVLSAQKISGRSKAQILRMLDMTLDTVCSNMPPGTTASYLFSQLYSMFTREGHSLDFADSESNANMLLTKHTLFP